MTPWQTAQAAEQSMGQPQMVPGTLRITEVNPNLSNRSVYGRGTAGSAALEAALRYAQQGWKWLERKRTMQLSSRRLRVAETVSLGEKRSVSIIEVDGAQFLIGSSPTNVQLLAVLDKLSGKQSDKQISDAATLHANIGSAL